MDNMFVVVLFEFSGRVRDAFIKKGHKAISCDLIPSESNLGEHFQGDVRDMNLDGVDLIIAHPDCTYVAVSGARWWDTPDWEWQQGISLGMFQLVLDLPVPRIAVEHPVSLVSTTIRPPDQYIQPWQFGHGETKKTGLWLKNLPLLQPTNVVEGRVGRVWLEAPSPKRKKNRSRTYQGIADAMAEQWSNHAVL